MGPNGECAGWFSLVLDAQTCATFGSTDKETIIYELELLGACVALDVWADVLASAYPVHYGDNDSVRFALIRGTALGPIAESIMNLHLHIEVQYNSNIWFARVPTEANIADIPSRFEHHPFLPSDQDISSRAQNSLTKFLKEVTEARRKLDFKGGRGAASSTPRPKKRSASLL